jgi:hypothetical protein
MRLWVTVALVLLLAPVAFARDIFVAPGGEDTAPGTREQPLGGLRQACEIAQPGDAICLRAGDYPRAVYWDSGGDGTAAAPIVIRSYDGDRTARLASLTLHGRHYVHLIGLDIDGRGGGNAFHVDGRSQYITLQRSYVHDAGPDGDCVKVNQCDHISIEGNEIARPGLRGDGETYQEGIDFVDVDASVMRGNYVHDFGDMALYTKGGSEDTVIENNVISHQLSHNTNPATGFGQQSDPPLMRGAEYQSYRAVFRNNIIRDCPGGAIGTYDCFQGAFYNNLVLNCGERRPGGVDSGIVHQRTSTTWMEGDTDSGRTTGADFFNNVFLDTRGEMPIVYQFRSGNYSEFRTGNNAYYNAGQPVPSAGLVDPNKEAGAVFANPRLLDPEAAATSYDGWLKALRLTAASRPLMDRGAAYAGRLPRPGVTTDITGLTRPQGRAWDIGPYEWPSTYAKPPR